MAQRGNALRTQEARRGDPGARLRGRALSPDRTMEAGDGLPQEPEGGHPGAPISDVERREDLNGLTPCRTAWQASGRGRRRSGTVRSRALCSPPRTAAARLSRAPMSEG